MRSHHAPTSRLLKNFLRSRGEGKESLWVYMRQARPRQATNLIKVGTENRYFAADPDGRSEETIEGALNQEFESDFHALLPTLLSPFCVIVSDEMRQICANYVGNLFLRSKPLRKSCQRFTEKVQALTLKKLEDPLLFVQYAAQFSIRTGRPIGLEAFREVVNRTLQDSAGMADRLFYQRATTGFSQLPGVLGQLNWKICRTSGPEFLQSDAAVALLNISPLRNGGTMYGFGISRLGSIWYLPISPHVCLSVSRHNTMESVLSTRRVTEINEFLIRGAVTSVYSSSYDDQIRTAVDSHLGDLDYFSNVVEVDLEKASEDALVWPHW